MKFFVQGKTFGNPRNIMRRAGYGELMKGNGSVSYARRLSGREFPRLHVYLEQTAEGISVAIHLDQKGACYRGTSAHSGEYDGPIVETEARRIQAVFASLS